MIYVPAGGDDGVPVDKRRLLDRKRSRIAVSSSTGTLVQTEEERLLSTLAWRTNLLKHKQSSQATLDPMLSARSYSKEELAALQVQAKGQGQGKGTVKSVHLPKLKPELAEGNSIVEDEGIRVGVAVALDLERELRERMRKENTICVTAPKDNALQSASFADSASDRMPLQDPSISMESLGQMPPITPFTLDSPGLALERSPQALNMRTLDEAIADAHAQAERENKNRSLSPIEHSTRLRRYKIGLSPMQKVKNMLDDIVSRYPQDGRPAAPTEHSRTKQQQHQQQHQQQQQNNQHSEQKKIHHHVRIKQVGATESTHELLMTDADTGEASSFIENGFRLSSAAGEGKDMGDDLSSGRKSPNFLFGGSLEAGSAISADSLALTRATYEGTHDASFVDVRPQQGLFQNSVWSPENEGDANAGDDWADVDEALPLLLDGQVIQRSVTLDPLPPDASISSAEAAIRHSQEVINQAHRNRLVKVKAARAAMNGVALTPNDASATATASLLFTCNRCTLAGKLWCSGCKLAFCYTCWGLVEHHRALDSVKAMVKESKINSSAFLTADRSTDSDGEVAPATSSQLKLSKPTVIPRSTKKVNSQDVHLAPAVLEFDEENCTHFAADKKDPLRKEFLLKLKVKRLAETSGRMLNILRLRRVKGDEDHALAEKRLEKVRRKVDQKHRQKELEEKLNKALEEESVDSGIGGMELGKLSKKQIDRERAANTSQSRSPSPGARIPFRKERILSPVDRKIAEAEEIARLQEDPAAGWGWSEMPAKASLNSNIPTLPFTDPTADLEWAVPDHIKKTRGERGGGEGKMSPQATLVRSLW